MILFFPSPELLLNVKNRKENVSNYDREKLKSEHAHLVGCVRAIDLRVYSARNFGSSLGIVMEP